MSKKKIMAALAAAILAGVASYFGLAADPAEPGECCACEDAQAGAGDSDGGSSSDSGDGSSSK